MLDLLYIITDYRNLGMLKVQFPDVPLLGVTATATSHVRFDYELFLV